MKIMTFHSIILRFFEMNDLYLPCWHSRFYNVPTYVHSVNKFIDRNANKFNY